MKSAKSLAPKRRGRFDTKKEKTKPKDFAISQTESEAFIRSPTVHSQTCKQKKP